MRIPKSVIAVLLWLPLMPAAFAEGQWRLLRVSRNDNMPKESKCWVATASGEAGKIYSTQTHVCGKTPLVFRTVHTWTPPPERLVPGEVIDLTVSVTVLENQLTAYFALSGTHASYKRPEAAATTAGTDIAKISLRSSNSGAGTVLTDSNSTSKTPTLVPGRRPSSFPDGRMKIVVWAGPPASSVFSYLYQWVDEDTVASAFNWSGIRLNSDLTCAALSGRTTDNCSVRFESRSAAIITWPDLNSVHRLSVSEEGNTLRMEENTAIQRGRAKLGCVYILEKAGAELKGGYRGCGNGTFSIGLQGDTPASGFDWKGVPLNAELPCAAVYGRSTDACKLRFESRATAVITWPDLNSVHRLSVSEEGSALRMEENTAIQRGRAKLGCVYSLRLSGSELTGNYSGCGSGSFTVRIR